jgi:hypothetical protein
MMFETIIQGLQGIRQKVLAEVPEGLRLYIPLQGKHSISLEETTFDLHENVQTFLAAQEEVGVAAAANAPNVLLMMGDAGSGKSIFCQTLYLQLWQQYKPNSDMPIPLWIPLPHLKSSFGHVVESVFSSMGFSKAQIAELQRTECFVFIVDGYDELHNFQNIYTINHWDKWRTKVLMTCRTQALCTISHYERYFIPLVAGRFQPQMLKRIHIAPFSEAQINAYLEQAETNELLIAAAAREQLASVPGLFCLIATPFFLYLAIEALPDIFARYKRHTKASEPKITHTKLLDIFIDNWFRRQEAKIKASGYFFSEADAEDIKPKFWHYCKTLAQLMHTQKISYITYSPKQNLFLSSKASAIHKTLDELFSPDNEVIRSACLLRKLGNNQYTFIHESVLEYFAIRSLFDYESVSEIKSNGNIAASAELEIEPDLPKLEGSIHQRLFVQETNTIKFSVDRVQESEIFKSSLFKLIEQSKHDERYAIGAANAITILNRAKINFSNRDFRGVRIAGADLSGAILNATDFTDADLTGVILREASLKCTCLVNTKIENVDFGEPRLMVPDMEVNAPQPQINNGIVAGVQAHGAQIYAGRDAHLGPSFQLGPTYNINVFLKSGEPTKANGECVHACQNSAEEKTEVALTSNLFELVEATIIQQMNIRNLSPPASEPPAKEKMQTLRRREDGLQANLRADDLSISAKGKLHAGHKFRTARDKSVEANMDVKKAVLKSSDGDAHLGHEFSRCVLM